MSIFNQAINAATPLLFQSLGEQVSYAGDGDPTSIYVAVDQEDGSIALGSRVTDTRYVAQIQRADVPTPRRGHTFTRSDGTVWVLQEELDDPRADEYVAVWSATKQ